MHFTSFRVNLFLPLVSKPLTKYFFFVEATFKPFFRDKFLFLKNLKIRKWFIPYAVRFYGIYF